MDGSPLEIHSILHAVISPAGQQTQSTVANAVIALSRWSLAASHHHSPQLSALPTEYTIRNAHFPPQHLLHNRRDLPHLVNERALEPRVYDLDHPVGHPSVTDGPATGVAVECGCRGAPARWGYRGLGESCAILDRRRTVAGAGEYCSMSSSGGLGQH